MTAVAYHLIRPEQTRSSVVFASPHSGRDYNWSFLRKTVLNEHSIRTSEDAFVDRLYEAAPGFGAPLLLAGVPRAFIDLNRSADELDPALIDGVRGLSHNPRIASGLGVVPRVVAGGRAIYRGKLALEEVQGRISRYWRPYHATLQRLLDEAHGQFGEAILIDCHSMPHEAMDGDRISCLVTVSGPLPPAVSWTVSKRRSKAPVLSWRATPLLPARTPRSITDALPATSMWYRSKSIALST